MANYTVVKGDSLWSIAEKKLGAGYRWTEIKRSDGKTYSLNDCTIYPGDVLILPSSGGGTPPKKNTTYKPKIQYFGPQAGTERQTLFATWQWNQRNTSEYRYIWCYATGDGVWFIGSDSTTKYNQCTYSVPSNAKKVRFKVMAKSKTHKVKSGKTEKDVAYWTGAWSTYMTYTVVPPPKTPSAPTVTIEKFKLTAELNNLDVNATSIEFQVVKDDKIVFKTGTSAIKTSHASYSCTVTAGSEYKVRCRSVQGKYKSEWSTYSENQGTITAASSGITELKALTENSVQLTWAAVKNAKEYVIEYTTKKMYFDSSSGVQSTTVDATKVHHAEITGLSGEEGIGQEWFFRVKATNDAGDSAWTEIKSIVLGKKPTAPTTWSSTTTGVVTEPVRLYWIHNSQDGSSQTSAQLELDINGTVTIKTIENSTSEEEKDKTSVYSINTSSYTEGTKIKWRVRTRGILPDYSDWSTQRTIDIYAPPTLSIGINNAAGEPYDVITSFPFYISGIAGPNTQKPVGYHVEITSNETYDTIDPIGNEKVVKKGESVYSKYFDTSEDLLVEITASNINIDNNIGYTVTCTVSMDSGLTDTDYATFSVAWTDEEYSPNAEIIVDEEAVTANIRPYCEDEDGNLIDGITLSVYRREYDGKFTEIGTGINNTSQTFVTDPHPSLDLARYRIVAISNSTGAVSFYDVPGYPMGVSSVIIQWDEGWSNFDTPTEDAFSEEQPWSGSMLKLPYNIDVSDNNTADVSLVKYIGREHPVTYYGTQLGVESNWNVVIDAEDVDTLYALRRLSVWMGDVYVREPSGSGYWANLSVSFSQKHDDLTIPVTLNLKRVEGGM